ncbi:hypothetical protein CHS0354_043185 [Potamilus streckersoni]|uniref:Uncharacterized protein n=1 Tax=Potamilus streckersoni TaxID=2493646 RepID=A0AAE0SNV4_9BIVA|nr:hypothetical protein CHS0354_043185 [Potamilus streckersoni]
MADREKASQRHKSSKTKRRRTRSQRNARRQSVPKILKKQKIPPTVFPLKSVLKIPIPDINSENLIKKDLHAKDRTNKITPENGYLNYGRNQNMLIPKQSTEMKEVCPKIASNGTINSKFPPASDCYVYKHEFVEVVGEKILHKVGLKMYRLEWKEIDTIKREMPHLLIFQCGGGCFVQGEKEMLEARKTFPSVNKLTVVSICIDNGVDHFNRCINGQQGRRYNVLHVEFHSRSSGDLHECLCNGENYQILAKLDSTDFKEIRAGLDQASVKLAVVEARIVQAKQDLDEHSKRLQRLERLKEDVTKTVSDIKMEGVESKVTVERMETTLKKWKKLSRRKKGNGKKNKVLGAMEARQIDKFISLKGPTKFPSREIDEFTNLKGPTKSHPITITSPMRKGCCQQIPMCVLL